MDSFVQKNANPIDRFVSGQNFLNFFVSRRSSEAYLKWFIYWFCNLHRKASCFPLDHKSNQYTTGDNLVKEKVWKKSSEKAQIKKCKTFYNSIGEQTIINYNQQ